MTASSVSHGSVDDAMYEKLANIVIPGENYDRGRKIHLRFRSRRDPERFLPIGEVITTMLHELTHNHFDPHDEKFYELYNELRGMHDGLIEAGFTVGDGLWPGHCKLGVRRIPEKACGTGRDEDRGRRETR